MINSKRRYITLICFLVFLLFISTVISLCTGQYKISVSNVLSILFGKILPINPTWSDTMYRVVIYSRLPRVIASIFVGGSLAIAGAAYQGVFKNPLVSPDILGVSNGACVGAAISILCGFGYLGNVIFAFIGGIAAVSLTVLLPILLNKKSTVTLVLSGVIVGGFFSSLLGLLKYLASPDTELAEITYWQLGSLSKVKANSLFFIIPVMVVSGLIIIFLRWRINVLSLGDKESQALGIDILKERGLVIICSTILTASSVCISGTIGWIGLIMPHLARLIVGQDNTRVIPTTMLLSNIFLVIVDLLARNLTGAEIPLSILIGFVGTPFFAYVLIRQKKGIQ